MSAERLEGAELATRLEHRADVEQGGDRVPEMGQDRADVDHVEGRVDAVGSEVVEVADDALDVRAERPLRELETLAEDEAVGGRLRLEPRPVHGRPVGVDDRLQVRRRHLGAALFHLEGPEAVEGADVEHLHAAHVVGQHLRRRLAHVDVAGRDDARGELDRVVPEVRVALERLACQRRIAGRRTALLSRSSCGRSGAHARSLSQGAPRAAP